MQWTQIYDPLGHWWLSTLVASLPIIVLFSLLAGLKVKPHWCAIAGASTAAAVAMIFFRMPPALAAMSFGYGVAYGILKIAWIVLAAVYLYDISVETGQFEIMKESVAGITADRRLQVLLVAFCFGAFIEGAAGFGAPVAIAGAFMIGLGFKPFHAAALNLIANTAPVAWGAIGDAGYLTPQAADALAAADALYGYGPYLDRVPERPGQSRHASDNREEGARAAAALRHAAQGASVAVVSGGDPGVFAMAAAICEQIESGPEAWRALDVEFVPGITAMLAVAARIGAPLGHDFCALSLSDNLKPWNLVERRLDAAADAGFVIALYNPISRARPWQLGHALERLRRHLPEATPVVFGRAVGRSDERVSITTLGEADAANADMATLIIIGSRETRVIARAGKPPLVYTPRAAAKVSA